MKIIRQNKINAVINRVAANFIIASDALARAGLPVEPFKDCVEHLTENTSFIAKSVGGKKGLMRLDSIIRDYYKIKRNEEDNV